MSHVSFDERLNGGRSADRKEGCLQPRLPVLLSDSLSVLVFYFCLYWSPHPPFKLPDNTLSSLSRPLAFLGPDLLACFFNQHFS